MRWSTRNLECVGSRCHSQLVDVLCNEYLCSFYGLNWLVLRSVSLVRSDKFYIIASVQLRWNL